MEKLARQQVGHAVQLILDLQLQLTTPLDECLALVRRDELGHAFGKRMEGYGSQVRRLGPFGPIPLDDVVRSDHDTARLHVRLVIGHLVLIQPGRGTSY